MTQPWPNLTNLIPKRLEVTNNHWKGQSAFMCKCSRTMYTTCSFGKMLDVFGFPQNMCLGVVSCRSSIAVSGSLIPQLAVYITYIPLIYCQLGDYMLPTSYQGNQETPLSSFWSWHFSTTWDFAFWATDWKMRKVSTSDVIACEWSWQKAVEKYLLSHSIHVWYTYLHVPHFTIKHNQM